MGGASPAPSLDHRDIAGALAPARFRFGRFEGIDEGVDLCLGHILARHDREQPTDRHHVARLGDQTADGSAFRCLDRTGDLGRLHLDDFVHRRDRFPFLDQPCDQLAVGFGHAPFGHGDRRDAVPRHGRPP
jgi:hypothetical protein